MQQPTPPIELPTFELNYQPEPSSVAGFIASMSDKVNELLEAAQASGPGLEGT